MIRNFVRIFFFSLSLIIISCAATECGERKISTPLVVNGEQSAAGEWPWLVTLHRSSNNLYFCGSSLINENMLVTGKKFNFKIFSIFLRGG
jgi:secreted trypsin-like serine protease